MDLEPGLYCPRFICDACERPITHHKDGLYLWLRRARLEQPAAATAPVIASVHNDGCDRDFERRQQLGRRVWGPIGALLAFLASDPELQPRDFVKVRRRSALRNKIARSRYD
ncbi:MAG TPA: hypothetical protein VKV26_10230 [Dehalococcoidia bacterium]|nr:hypothetical protein [Dehalococcoidia bacterium]